MQQADVPANGRPSGASPLVAKLEQFLPLGLAERQFLERLEAAPSVMSARCDLIRQDESYQRVYVVRSGWAIRHKSLPEGQRQVINFVLPGDFVGLHATVFPKADHSVTSLTEVSVATFPPELVLDLFKRFPRLAAAVAWSGAREEAVIAEHLASIGRRPAYQRLAHLLLELLHRLRNVGLARDDGFTLPVTQQVLADAMGLSIVHVNRTLGRLRSSGLIETYGQEIVISSPEKLERAVEFDRQFLHMRRSPAATEQKLRAASSG